MRKPKPFTDLLITPDVLVWRVTVDGVDYEVPIGAWIHRDALRQGRTQVHLYPGMGEEMGACYAGVKALADLGIPAVGVVTPFYILPPTVPNLELTAITVPHFVAAEFNKRAGNPALQPVDIIGKSQSAFTALISAGHAPKRFRKVALWGPPALTSEFMGRTLDEQRRTFYRRLWLQNLLRKEQQIWRDSGNLKAARELAIRLRYDLRGRRYAGDKTGWRDNRLKAKVNYALGTDLMSYVRTLAEQGKIGIFAGRTDPVFRLHEYQAVLGREGLLDILHEVRGSHVSLFARAARPQLEVIVDWLQASKT